MNKATRTRGRSSEFTVKPSFGHTPVSSFTETVSEVEGPSKVLQQAPSEGKNPKTQRVRQDGTEDVSGFTLHALGMEAPEPTAPDTSNLRDIAEASFGRPGPVVVFPPDDRVQITNTAIYPWRVQASLLITANDGSQWIGTGWFIGPHTLMTAGHVVFIKNSGVPNRDGWVRSIQVMPGRNGSQLPHGTVTSTNFRSVNGWTLDGDQTRDYGAIILPTNLGDTVGWLGFGVYSDSDLLASVGNISGYPGDKPNGTQWYDARRIASVDARKVYYTIDTVGGQSGSAVYRIVNGARMAFAIHAYGGATANSGTRIITSVFNNMIAWKD